MKAVMRFVVASTLVAGSLFGNTAEAQQVLGAVGSVFVMSNSAQGNAVLAYGRTLDGSLVQAGTYATGGNGSGGGVDPLHSQGSLVLSADRLHLFAVNAGSGTVSSFQVFGQQLRLVDTKPSGGSFPTALAQRGNLLYVLNTGGTDNVTGFTVNFDGTLTQIPNSTKGLSEAETDSLTGASSLAISPDLQYLAVTERISNKIDVFHILPNGTLSQIVVNPSAGTTPFAAVFAPNGALLVAEAGSNSISSYRILSNQTLETLTSALPSEGKATCWSVISPNGLYAYTANAGTATISGFDIAPRGQLQAIDGGVVGSNLAGATNIDIAVTGPGLNAPFGYLYSVNTGTGSIGRFAIGFQGGLTYLGATTGLPVAAGLNGIAGY
jgi:6-phosphogluconolactonase (cycloisomerase 2 family)